MSNRQKDDRHNQQDHRGMNNQDPQARHEQESQDWKDAQRAGHHEREGGIPTRAPRPGEDDDRG